MMAALSGVPVKNLDGDLSNKTLLVSLYLVVAKHSNDLFIAPTGLATRKRVQNYCFFPNRQNFQALFFKKNHFSREKHGKFTGKSQKSAFIWVFTAFFGGNHSLRQALRKFQNFIK